MPAKSYFSYVRVSTQRQGQNGTSLAEQQAAIERYAQRFNLHIAKQYEERETAAKQGRPVFLEMLKALKNGGAAGLITHKIDRSARNLKDWADLGALIDGGTEVHFANESLDLNSRGGRLSADIQAVVAADYIRNLREETKKGIYGRLRQGLYPFPARVGYLDAGKANAKKLDPVQAPLVRRAFELYASGNYGLNALVEKMYELGLRNKNGKKISRNGLVCILKNPFYMGLIKIDSVGELFVGIHPKIISKSLFDEVQNVFAGKRVRKKLRHFFVFRRLINCQKCQELLIAERQKGNVYYRCQTKECPQKTIREEVIEAELLETYERLQLTNEEYECLKIEAEEYIKDAPKEAEIIRKQLLMEVSQIETRLTKLADAYVDEVFDKETYLVKKNELVIKRQGIKEKLESKNNNEKDVAEQLREFLELLKSVYLSYKTADDEEKREMVQITTLNFTVERKLVSIKLRKPFELMAERLRFPVGSPTLATTRTFRDLCRKLTQYFKREAISKNANQ
ncbi:MAG: recombinase family protein [Acidobacteria bacterium]|nr:recombinase family protein [Acidobacteriota bacterium]MCA1637088.1 recombinase family protein [Acidobacteriota bacterium]